MRNIHKLSAKNIISKAVFLLREVSGPVLLELNSFFAVLDPSAFHTFNIFSTSIPFLLFCLNLIDSLLK